MLARAGSPTLRIPLPFVSIQVLPGMLPVGQAVMISCHGSCPRSTAFSVPWAEKYTSVALTNRMLTGLACTWLGALGTKAVVATDPLDFQSTIGAGWWPR